MSGMKHCFTYILYSVFQNKTKKTSVNLYIYICRWKWKMLCCRIHVLYFMTVYPLKPKVNRIFLKMTGTKCCVFSFQNPKEVHRFDYST